MTDTLVPTASPPPPSRPRSKRALTALGLVVLAASAVFGADPYGVRERVLGSATPEPERPAAGRSVAETVSTIPADPAAPQKTVLRSQPWWQGVATFEGTGATTTAPFTIDGRAIQWRARWSCQAGHLELRGAGSDALVSSECPGEGIGYARQTGPLTLTVAAQGPWRLQIDQQIDLPLAEPPLPAMTAPGAARVATGQFYRIDQFGEGEVSIYRLPDGTYALRLEDFYVTPNVDLTIELSSLQAPRTSEEFRGAASASVATLDVTAGSMNFRLPPGIDPTAYRSVVIWCEPVLSAYAAANLGAAA